MKKPLFAAGMLLLLASCAGSSASYESLPGYWLESMPANPQIIQGLRLDADGSAASIGMHTLKYTGWTRQDDRLILRGQSIGNGQTIEFSDTLDIVRLDGDTLTLEKHGMYRIDYKRADFTVAGGMRPLDSLRRPSPASVLDIRTFEGTALTETGDEACSVTLFTYDNSGDGIFCLATSAVSGDTAERVGRMFTLRGDASDKNAVVYELRPFDGGEPYRFRYRDDRLEQLDTALTPPLGSGNRYTLTLK